MIATSLQSRQILGVNQQSYQALKASMSLDLRRQLLIAVCDNVVMQNHLAEQLEQDLAAGEKALKLERLMFDPEEGNLPQQVAQWVRQTMLSEGDLPKIQMVGIEQMTRQPAITQNYFLRSLEKIEALLPRLNTSLLIWVPWPWLRTIQQSSPTFWSWRNGVYEFISDPTPASAEPEPLSPAFPPAESVAQDNSHQNGSNNGHQNGSTNGQNHHQNGNTNGGHQNGSNHHHQDVSDEASEALASLSSTSLYGEGSNGKAAESNSTETRSDDEQVPIELLDDGLDDGLNDGLDDDVLTRASTFSTTSTSSAAPQPTPNRTDLASLGGLRSVVSQGINMRQAVDEDNAALFDAIVADPEDLPEDAFIDDDMDAAEQVAAEFASLDWDDFLSESDRAEDTVAAKPPRQQTTQPPISAPAPQAAQATPVQKLQEKKSQEKKSQSDIPLFEPASHASDQAAESDMPDPTHSIAVTSVAVEKPSAQGKRNVVRKPLTLTPVQPPSVESEPVQTQTALVNESVPLLEPPLPELLPEPLISESADDTISAPDSSDTSSSTVLKVGDRRELRANAQTATKDVRESAKLASEYFATGLAYRNRIEAGDRGLSMIDPAIIAYENGLKHLANPHPDRITALNDLGTLYWLKAQQQPDQTQAAQHMHQSVRLYQEALVASDRQQTSEASQQPSQQPSQQYKGIVGQLYSNMGAVYTMLATCEDPLENLTHAARTYQRALPLISLVSDPEEYATLQNSLGSVFWKLSHYESAENYLHQAISAYNEALLGYKPEQQPLDYAAVQNNLGITYWSLAKHERPEFLLKHAIAAYRDALNYRTSEVDPAACAISYNNLALAYWDLSKHTHTDFAQKSRYQKNAVTAFEAALNISKLSGALSQMDSAAIYHCLGDVHAQMVETAASRNDIADSLQKSLYSYIKATEDLPTDSPAYPGRFGAIVANLRLHYDKLGLEGQQTALNRVPASLLPQVMMTL